MVRDTLAQEIGDGTFSPGQQLPTEPELIARFKVGRHSVRRAVDQLAREGKVSIEQGRGTFIAEEPLLTYAIGKRTRRRQNLASQTSEISGELLGADLIEAPRRVRTALGLDKGAMVVESRRLTSADGVPLAFGSSFHDASVFSEIVERRDVLGSMTEAYKSYGIDDYIRGETTLHARPSKPEEAKLLRQHGDLPVLVVRSVDTLLDGTPICFSQVIWASGRIKFTMLNNDND